MFKPHQLKWMGAVVLALAVSSCSVDAPTEASTSDDTTPIVRNGDLVPGQYIVAFNDYAVARKGEDLQALTHSARLELVKEAATGLTQKHALSAGAVKTVWGTAVQGVLMQLTDDQAAKLRQDPTVRYVEQDRWVTLPPFTVMGDADAQARPGGGGGGTQPAQETPWGITKVGGAVDATSSTVKAWIVDSGIDTDHPDLNVNKGLGRNYVTSGKSTVEDGNGHGTHVAGTVGAKNNSIGVVGVAAGITVIPMRVLSSSGSGQFSWSISAFDHIAANAASGDVVNYSVGPSSRYTLQSLDNAVTNVASKGIKVCLAAGNAADDCTYFSPARVNVANVYTIAAMNSSTAWASFSNYGGPVDYIEPGVGVKSTWLSGGYNTISGTSMASPHGCGIAAVGGFADGGTVSGVPAGTTTTWGKHN